MLNSVAARRFSPLSSTHKADDHDIADILFESGVEHHNEWSINFEEKVMNASSINSIVLHLSVIDVVSGEYDNWESPN